MSCNIVVPHLYRYNSTLTCMRKVYCFTWNSSLAELPQQWHQGNEIHGFYGHHFAFFYPVGPVEIGHLPIATTEDNHGTPNFEYYSYILEYCSISPRVRECSTHINNYG